MLNRQAKEVLCPEDYSPLIVGERCLHLVKPHLLTQYEDKFNDRKVKALLYVTLVKVIIIQVFISVHAH